MGPGRRHALIGSSGRVGERRHDRDRDGLRPRVGDPPLEHPDRKRAALEVAGDHRRQLLADEPHADHVGLEGLPRPREQRVVRAAADRQVPTPPLQRVAGRSDGEHGRPGRAIGTADEQREAVGHDRLEPVMADIEVPAREVATERPPDAAGAQPSDGDPGPFAVVDHRHVDPWPSDVGARLADRSSPGDVRDDRPVDGRAIGLGFRRRHVAHVTSRRR